VTFSGGGAEGRATSTRRRGTGRARRNGGVDFSRREAEIYRILRQVRGGRAGHLPGTYNKRITVILKTIISQRASQPRGDDLPTARGMVPLSPFVVELIPGLATV